MFRRPPCIMPGTRQRFIEASDTEWERVTDLARVAGESVGRFLIRKATAREAVPVAVLRRAMREILILSSLEEYRTRELGAGERFDHVAHAVDAWLEREDDLAQLADPGATNRWRAR